MAVRSEEIQLRIVASGNAAKIELADLAQVQEDLKRKIDGLDKKSKDYAATKRKLSAELQQTNERMRKLRSEIDLNSMSMRDLRNRANDLKRVMDNMKPNTPEWNRLNGQLQQTNARMRELRGSTQQMGSTWGSMMNAVKGGILAFAGIQGVQALWNGAKNAVAAYTTQAQAVAKVNQAITSTAGAAGLSLEQLRQEASNLQKKTLFGDETILNDATAQLLTFTNIANDNFLRTQRVALDLSTVLDGDLKSASIQLGKALNDPVANLSALSRSGIQFSAAQKSIIKELAETNRLAEAQGVILDELERQYGGQAETAAAVGGGWKQMSNALGDVMEEIGGFITALFNTDAATASLTDTIANIAETIRGWAAGVLQARQWMRDWYDDSVVLRGAVQLLSAGIKTNILFLVQFLDMAIVKPVQGIIAGIKATRLVMEGEFKQAGAVLKNHFNVVVDDWKQFGSDYKEIWSDAIDEVRNPAPWQELGTNATNAAVQVKSALEQAKADIDAFLRNDTIDADAQLTAGDTSMPEVDKWIQERNDFQQALDEMRRTARQQDLYLEEEYWNEMMALNDQYQTGATDLEERKRAAMAEINKKWDQQELDAVRMQELAKQEIKRETFQQAAQMSSQFLGFIGQYMEKGSAAQIATTSAQIAIDTASSISSAISGATKAAEAGGPTAPFLILGYITSMIGSVMSAFTNVKSMMDSAQAAKVDTDLDVPAFATGTQGSSVTPAGWKLVGEQGPELINTPGGEKIINAPDTASILAKYNMGGLGMLPAPSYTVDTSALLKSVQHSVPGFASGTSGAMDAFTASTAAAGSGMAKLETLMREMIMAVKEEKQRPAIVSQRQFKDVQADIDYIRNFSDIRAT